GEDRCAAAADAAAAGVGDDDINYHEAGGSGSARSHSAKLARGVGGVTRAAQVIRDPSLGHSLRVTPPPNPGEGGCPSGNGSSPTAALPRHHAGAELLLRAGEPAAGPHSPPERPVASLPSDG